MADVLAIELRLGGLDQLDIAKDKATLLEDRIASLKSVFEDLADTVKRSSDILISAFNFEIRVPHIARTPEVTENSPTEDSSPANKTTAIKDNAGAPGISPFDRLQAAYQHLEDTKSHTGTSASEVRMAEDRLAAAKKLFDQSRSAAPPTFTPVGNLPEPARVPPPFNPRSEPPQFSSVGKLPEPPRVPPPFNPRSKPPEPPRLQAGPFQRQQEAQQNLERVNRSSTSTERDKRDAAYRLAQATDVADRALRKLAGTAVAVKQLPIGPAQRLEEAKKQFERAKQSGTPEQKLDAQIALQHAEASKASAEKKLQPVLDPGAGRGRMADLTRARVEYVKAQRSGTPEEKFDTRIKLGQAERSFQMAQKSLEPRSFANALGNVIKTSRYGIGSSGKFEMMPLVGRSLSALMGLGPLGIAVGAVTAAFTGLYSVTQQAAANITAFGSAQVTSGGTGEETAQLRGLGGAVGMTTQEMAGMARQLREQKGNNPYAMGYFGADVGGDPLGKIDVAQGLIDAIEKLRAMHDAGQDDKAIRAMRVAGLEPVQRLVFNTSSDDFKRIMDDAKQAETVYSKAAEDSAQRLNISSSRLSQAWQDMINRMGISDFFAKVENAGASIINPMAEDKNLGPRAKAIMDDARKAEKRGDRVQVAADSWAALFAKFHDDDKVKKTDDPKDKSKLLDPNNNLIPHHVDSTPGGHPKADDNSHPVVRSNEKLRDAIEGNTQVVLRANAQGTNIQSTGHYLPVEWKGPQLNQVLKDQARTIGFGAFGG